MERWRDGEEDVARVSTKNMLWEGMMCLAEQE